MPLAFLLATAIGAATAAPVPLSLTACIDRAVARHPAVAIAAIDQKSASARLTGVLAQRLPSLSVESGYLYTSTKDGNLDFVANNAPHETRAQLWLRWQPDTGALSASLRRAQAEHTAAEWGIRQARARLVLDVATAYYGVLRTQHAHLALREAVAGAHRQLQATQRLVDVGKASRFDLQRTASAVAMQEARLAQAEADQKQYRRRLALQVGDVGTVPLAEPIEPQVVPRPTALASPASRADVRQAEALIPARQADVDLAKRALWPQVSFAAAGGLDTGTWPGLQQLGWQAGVDLSWPVWDWGILQRQVEAAQLTVSRAEAEVQLAARAAAGDVIDAEAQVDRATGQLAALKRAGQAADAALLMAQRGFAEGGVGSLDVLLAQQAAIEARLAQQSARYDYFTALAYYRWATTGTEPGQ
ncbi:MAG: TolC family protein [Candidatus Sericytochromatia bacterium]|nr:TolC family protein [Candidatus Sericytochromatia bacterium]